MLAADRAARIGGDRDAFEEAGERTLRETKAY